MPKLVLRLRLPTGGSVTRSLAQALGILIRALREWEENGKLSTRNSLIEKRLSIRLERFTNRVLHPLRPAEVRRDAQSSVAGPHQPGR